MPWPKGSSGFWPEDPALPVRGTAADLASCSEPSPSGNRAHGFRSETLGVGRLQPPRGCGWSATVR
jgi:hypothetical protein